MIKKLLSIVPANTLASFVASIVTKALQKIGDKEKLLKVSEAVAACSTAVSITSDAIKDAEITEEEVNTVSDSVAAALEKIIEASK